MGSTALSIIEHKAIRVFPHRTKWTPTDRRIIAIREGRCAMTLFAPGLGHLGRRGIFAAGSGYIDDHSRVILSAVGIHSASAASTAPFIVQRVGCALSTSFNRATVDCLSRKLTCLVGFPSELPERVHLQYFSTFSDGFSFSIHRVSACNRARCSSTNSRTEASNSSPCMWTNRRIRSLQEPASKEARWPTILVRMFFELPMYVSRVTLCVSRYTPGFAGKLSLGLFRGMLLQIGFDRLLDHVRQGPLALICHCLKLFNEARQNAGGDTPALLIGRQLLSWHTRKSIQSVHVRNPEYVIYLIDIVIPFRVWCQQTNSGRSVCCRAAGIRESAKGNEIAVIGGLV